MRKVDLYLMIVAATAAIYLFFKFNALYFFIFLTAWIISMVARKAKKENRAFLITVIISMFIIGSLLGLLTMSMRGQVLSQDEGLYSKKAIAMVFAMKGCRNLEQRLCAYFKDRDMLYSGFGYNLYTYMLASFYSVFGYQIQAARFINMILNIFTFLVIFRIAGELFDNRVAKMSALIFAFYPSIMLWSVMLGIDSSALLGITAYMLSMIMLLKENKFELKWICVMIMSYFIISLFRAHVADVLLRVTVMVIAGVLFARLSRKIRASLVLIASAILIVSLLSPNFMHFMKTKMQHEVDEIVRRQWGFAEADDSSYSLYPYECYRDRSCTPAEFIMGYMKGASYVFFAPFPWKIESGLQCMAYPQVVIWFSMIPFMIYGFYLGFRRNAFLSLPVFLYVFMMVSIFAVAGGNVGALFRHKDMITPFVIIYFTAGAFGLSAIGKNRGGH